MSLAGFSPWGHKELDRTEQLTHKVLENPLGCKEIKPANPKGNKSWIFIRRTDAEAPVLWPPDAKSQFIRKDSDAGKDWRQKDKGTTEDEMVEWHHWLNEHEFEQPPGNVKGQRSQAICSPWGHKETGFSDYHTHTHSNCLFCFLRKYQSAFQMVCTIFCSHQLCMEV